MTKTIIDRTGIRHRWERGARHNTRCGRLVMGVEELPNLRDVDCMACVSMPSTLSIEDLRDGTEVEAWLELIDDHGNRTGTSERIIFSGGKNFNPVKFAGLVPGTSITGYRYHNEEDKTLWFSRLTEPIVVREGVDIEVRVGQARVD